MYFDKIKISLNLKEIFLLKDIFDLKLFKFYDVKRIETLCCLIQD